VAHYVSDLRGPFSDSKAVADAIRERREPGDIVAGVITTRATSIAGYLDEPIFMLRDRHWGTFSGGHRRLQVPATSDSLLAPLLDLVPPGSAAFVAVRWDLEPLGPRWEGEKILSARDGMVRSEFYNLYRVVPVQD
jgi:hypothetical protein